MITNLREQLERDEGGFQRHAYQDSETYWTIGFGRCIDKRRGKGISLAEAELLLENDIRDFSADVLVALPWAAGLDEPRRGVLINLAFNVGTQGLLGFKNFLAAMKAANWIAAAEHLLDSKWAHQVGPRARRLAKQVVDGEWQ